MIYIFTGDGKGKTTSAFGTALRALGRGKKVHIIQFMKSKEWFKPAEVSYLEKKEKKNLEIESFGRTGWVDPKKPLPEDIELAEKALNASQKAIKKEGLFLLIIDEIFVALLFKLINKKDIKKIMDEANENNIHLILTGRRAPRGLFRKANFVTEMKEIKHLYEDGKGQKAVEGLEY